MQRSGEIFRRVQELLRELNLPERVEADLLRVLEAAQPSPLPLIAALGDEAGLTREEILGRGAGLFLSYCAGHLADDLMDGDCDYIDPPRIGPCLQFLLQNLSQACLARTEIPRAVLAAAGLELARAAGPQPLEVLAAGPDAALYRRLCAALGHEWIAFLKLLWADTPLAERAERVGLALGIAGNVALDVQSHDPRLTTLATAEQAEILAWASQAAALLRAEGLRSLADFLADLDPWLRRPS